MEDAQSNRRHAAGRQMSPAEAEKNRRRESLLLSRTRVLRDLEAAQNPRYRETLSEALKHLDRKLAELE
jgi:hypothetical protein